MESVKIWFQDWSDACEYANECVPDFSFLSLSEPYSAFLSIAVAVFCVWWWNERGLARIHRREAEARLLAKGFATTTAADPLGAMLDRMSVPLSPAKQAA